MNEFKEDKKEFKIGVRKVLDKYYSMKKTKRGELKEFTKELDDSAKQIVKNYEEAEKERENQENLNYETEKVLLSFPHGTPMETVETIIGNEAVDYEVISDGERHIPEDLPDYKKERLAKAGDIKRDVVVLAETSLEDTVERAENKFENYACVESAEHNVYFEADGTISQDGYSATTNDPKFTNDVQWNLKNANVPRAWNRFKTVGSTISVWVAVIDSGVQMNHPDLKNNLLTSCSVDITNGNKKLTSYATANQYTEEHGTRVAGVLVAQANNGVGCAGVATMGNESFYRNSVKVMALKCDTTVNSRHVSNDKLYKAINYAVDNGAEVINISYSATTSDYGNNFSTLKTAVSNAIKSGVTVVCSAGNDASTTIRYPAGFAYGK